MKLIPLKNKKGEIINHAQVDDEDYERASKFNWHQKPHGKTTYAIRNVRLPCGKWTGQFLHRFVMNETNQKIDVHHKDHEGLNCQKYNLSSITHKNNCVHNSGQRNTTSKYVGVYWNVAKLKYKIKSGEIRHYTSSAWVAGITVNGKWKDIGRFKTEEQAAIARDKYAYSIFGNMAFLNFPNSIP